MSAQPDDNGVVGKLSTSGVTKPEGRFSDIPGDLTRQIGSGIHARDSIVFWTIRASFWTGGLLSAVVLALVVFKVDSPIGVKDVWSVFGPIITLTLGYFFGKGDK